MRYLLFIVLTVVTAVLSGCNKGPESPRGFSLPDGDAEQGKTVFLQYQCLSCHQLDGVEQSDIINMPGINIKLGGESVMIKTYAELVTSIINPSHRFARGYPRQEVQVDGVSKMNDYNNVMTVTELINIVSFLQPYYTLPPHGKTEYRFYGYK